MNFWKKYCNRSFFTSVRGYMTVMLNAKIWGGGQEVPLSSTTKFFFFIKKLLLYPKPEQILRFGLKMALDSYNSPFSYLTDPKKNMYSISLNHSIRAKKCHGSAWQPSRVPSHPAKSIYLLSHRHSHLPICDIPTYVLRYIFEFTPYGRTVNNAGAGLPLRA